MAGTWGARGRSRPSAGHQASQQGKAIRIIENWQATAKRQRDIIDRLTGGDEGLTLIVEETLAVRRQAYMILRDSGLSHEEAEDRLSNAMAEARGQVG